MNTPNLDKLLASATPGPLDNAEEIKSRKNLVYIKLYSTQKLFGQPKLVSSTGVYLHDTKENTVGRISDKEARANARLLCVSRNNIAELVTIAAELGKWEEDPDRYGGDLADLANKARTILAKIEAEAA